jgi:hypothetical protein
MYVHQEYSFKLKIVAKIFGSLNLNPLLWFIKFKHLFIHIKIKAMKTSNVNNLIFDVKKVAYTNSATLSDCAFDIIGYPQGIETRIQACSDRYELIPNAEIFPVLRTKLLNSQYSNFTETYENRNNCVFTAKYILEDMKIAIKTGGDIVKPTIIVNHSYNGQRKYSIKFGFFRLVCTNGLTIPVKEMEFLNLEIGGKHTISIRKSFEILNERLDYVTNNLKELVNGFNLLANENVTNWSERVIEVMNVAGINDRKIAQGKDSTGKKIASVAVSEGILETIRKESQLLYGGTVNNWLIYNGINQYIYNDNMNDKTEEAREKIDRKVLATLMS